MYNNSSNEKETKLEVMTMLLRNDVRTTCCSLYPLSHQ